MSLYDKASLIMTPSGAKATKLYSHKPHNGNGDFTHDRNDGTATRVNKDGYIETVAADVPRLDYPLIDGVVQDCPALLLEPSRSNLITNSNFQSGWSVLSGGSITQNQSISPDGTQNAAILSGDGVGANAAYTSINITAQEYTYSMFAKKGSEYILKMIGFSGGANGNVEFNLNNGTIETPSDGTFSNEKIEDYGNGWYRCIVKVTATSSGSKLFGFNREAIVSGNLFSVYGAQLEAGSYATSYIPTSGSSVTRNADVCDSAGTSAEFNDSEGVVYLETSVLANDGTYKQFTLNAGSPDNSIRLMFTDVDNQIRYFVRDSASTQADITHTLSNSTQFSKISMLYKANDFQLWVNGFKIGTDTSGTVPSGLDEIDFNDGGTSGSFYGRTKEVAVFKEALTDSELEALTSWDSFTEMAKSQEYSIR